jgi:hypothetical protein
LTEKKFRAEFRTLVTVFEPLDVRVSCILGIEAAGGNWTGEARQNLAVWCVPGALVRTGLAAIVKPTRGLFGLVPARNLASLCQIDHVALEEEEEIMPFQPHQAD